MHRNKIDMPRTKRLTRRAFALYNRLSFPFTEKTV